MKEKLAFVQSILDAYAIGIKNLPSILAAVVLYVLTVWVPYINVGTTIAICNLPVELSKGEIINPLSIFDSKYRHQMGEFILLYGIILIGIIVAAGFMFIPAIVLGLSWSQAIYLLLDKKINWAQCLTESNKLTMGYKWKIFFLNLALVVTVIILYLIVGFIGGSLSYAIGSFGALIGSLLMLLVVLATMTVSISLNAVIYRELQKSDEEVISE